MQRSFIKTVTIAGFTLIPIAVFVIVASSCVIFKRGLPLAYTLAGDGIQGK